MTLPPERDIDKYIYSRNSSTSRELMKKLAIMMLSARKLTLSGCGYARNKDKEQPPSWS